MFYDPNALYGGAWVPAASVPVMAADVPEARRHSFEQLSSGTIPHKNHLPPDHWKRFGIPMECFPMAPRPSQNPLRSQTDVAAPIIEDLIVSDSSANQYVPQETRQHWPLEPFPDQQQEIVFGSPAPSLPSSSGPLTPDLHPQQTQFWDSSASFDDYSMAHMQSPPAAVPVLPSQGYHVQAHDYDYWRRSSHAYIAQPMSVR